jgi:hypothetical protein
MMTCLVKNTTNQRDQDTYLALVHNGLFQAVNAQPSLLIGPLSGSRPQASLIQLRGGQVCRQLILGAGVDQGGNISERRILELLDGIVGAHVRKGKRVATREFMETSLLVETVKRIELVWFVFRNDEACHAGYKYTCT